MNYWHMQLHPGEFKEWSPDDIKKILLNNLIGCSGDPVDTFYKIKDGDVLLIRHGGSVVALVQAIGLPYKMDNNLKDDYLWFDHALKVKALEWYKDKYISGEGWYLPKTLMPVDNEIAYNYINELYTTHIKINQMKEAIDLLKYKKQIILQGPPGTGKTRMAQLIADVLIKAEIKLSPLQYLDWYVKNYKPSKESKDKNTARLLLLNEFTTSFPVANIINLTLDEYCMGKGLKDSFCYWIERKLGVLGTFSPGQAGNDVYGVYYSPKINNYKVTESDKPATEKLAVITYALNLLLTNEDYSEVKKIFRQSLILKILNSYFPDKYFPVFSQVHLKVIARILEINITGLDDIQINKKINENFLMIKSTHSSEISSFEFMRHLYDKFDIKGVSVIVDEVEVVETLGEKKLIQFHPAYTYEDFVRGITAETNTNGQVEYKVQNRVLAQFAQKALDNQAINYVLIIDEINRANLPSVLGELIYALEYRYDPDKPKENIVESMYTLKEDILDDTGDKTLKLPNNLFIIGTMNTADRSVGHIDYAIKRRFAFIDILPTHTAIDDVIIDVALKAKAKALFTKVSKLFNETKSTDNPVYLQSDFKAKDVQLGHSYFLADKLDNLQMKLEFEIKPILFEYIKDGVLSQDAEKEIKALYIND